MDRLRLAKRLICLWSWLIDSLERPLVFEEPEVHGAPGVVVFNHGDPRWISVRLVAIHPPVEGLTLPVNLAFATDGQPNFESKAGGTRVLLREDPRRVRFDFLVGRGGGDEPGQITIRDVGPNRENLPFGTTDPGESDAHYRAVLEIHGGGWRHRRTFRIRVYREQRILLSEGRERSRPLDLTTAHPGTRWVGLTLGVLVAVAAVATFTDPISSALVRGGLVLDAWGVWMLVWSAFRRVVLGNAGAALGGGGPHCDDRPGQRAADRATVRTYWAVTLIVLGFALQFAGQSM